MLRNKQCHRNPLCTMMSQVVLFSYGIKLNISRRELQKFYQRGYIVILSDLCNAIRKTLGKNFVAWAYKTKVQSTRKVTELKLDAKI